MTFYDRFAQLSREHGLTPCGAALKMGISKSTVTRWKKEPERMPNSLTMNTIAAFFDVSLDYLKGDAEEKEKLYAGFSYELKYVIDCWPLLPDAAKTIILTTCRNFVGSKVVPAEDEAKKVVV